VGEDENSMSLHLLVPTYDVIVLTPMVFYNHLAVNTVSLSDFSLLVADECHHTRGNNAYNNVMLYYLRTKHRSRDTKLPQVHAI
jgi:ERCC4-related helicase